MDTALQVSPHQGWQRSCGCPIFGSVQGHDEWGPEQPGLVGGGSAHGKAVGMQLHLRSILTQTIPWFYGSMIP